MCWSVIALIGKPFCVSVGTQQTVPAEFSCNISKGTVVQFESFSTVKDVTIFLVLNLFEKFLDS